MPTPTPADERRHPAGAESLWNESYYLDWFQADGSLGGYVRIGFYPNLGRVWYWACLVGPDRELLTVIEHEVPLPAGEQSLELRASGLWADHVVNEPLDRMSSSLEAFGLSVDHPTAVYESSPRGDLIPFGFDLEWETDRAAYLWPPVTPRYEIPCRVHGEVLVGTDTIEVDGWGQRDHSWGASRDWWAHRWCWSAGRLDDGTRWHAVGGLIPDSDWGVAYVLPPGATAFDEFDVVEVDADLDPDGLAVRARLEVGGLDLEVTPVAWSPVLLTHDDGRQARFPRALCTVTGADGRTGRGWFEWNQPPAG